MFLKLRKGDILTVRYCAILSVIFFCAMPASASQDTLRIYIDADFTVVKSAAESIEQGLRTALDEVDNSLVGHRVEIVRKNHRGSSPRSKSHLQQYLADEKALAIFAGLHSPPILAHRDYINEQEILLLVPWAAAGPITRYPSSQNWIFRLSIDDTKAGRVIARYAVQDQGYKRPYLLLENTGWGTSNEQTLRVALEEMGIVPAGVGRFSWNLSKPHARALIREVAAVSADVILLVANTPEAKILIAEMADMGVHIPICSHWGITGGDFTNTIDASTRAKIPLAFIQTRFSFFDANPGSWQYGVLESAKTLFPNQIKSAKDIRAPTGFIHTYDLTKIFIAAVEQAGLSGDIRTDRRNIRAALEQLDKPIRGLLKTYQQPYSAFGPDAADAHEALRQEDFAMARYGAEDEIILLTNQGD